jgi:hypothetical protein
VPARKLVHVILDNYAVHKHPKVRQWLARHPRSAFHFTPTSCSWLNAVEGFFAKLAKQRLKRGVFRGVVDLQATINRFVAQTKPTPQTIHLDHRPRQNHRRCQAWAPSVRFDPLDSDLGGLSLSGGRARCVQPSDRRLVYGYDPRHPAGARRLEHGARRSGIFVKPTARPESRQRQRQRLTPLPRSNRNAREGESWATLSCPAR